MGTHPPQRVKCGGRQSGSHTSHASWAVLFMRPQRTSSLGYQEHRSPGLDASWPNLQIYSRRISGLGTMVLGSGFLSYLQSHVPQTVLPLGMPPTTEGKCPSLHPEPLRRGQQAAQPPWRCPKGTRSGTELQNNGRACPVASPRVCSSSS